jgi:hypothetical protein
MCWRVADETTRNKDMHGSAAHLRAAIGRACVLPACPSPPRLSRSWVHHAVQPPWKVEPQCLLVSVWGGGDVGLDNWPVSWFISRPLGTTRSRRAGFPGQSLLDCKPLTSPGTSVSNLCPLIASGQRRRYVSAALQPVFTLGPSAGTIFG